MSTSSLYPGELDNDANLGRVDSLTAISPADHNNLVDSIEAIEATLGVNPQGASATVGARIAALGSGGGSGGAADSEWTSATLLNSWIAFGGSWAIPAYRKDSAGQVHIRGAVKNGSTMQAVMFSLPVGHRPGSDMLFVAWNAVGPVTIKVAASGDVLQEDSIGNPSTSFQSLDGISFWQEA